MHATSTLVTDPVTVPETTDPAPASPELVTVPDTLRAASRYLALHGWIQGTYYDATSGSFTPPACLVGAVGMVCYGGPVDAPALNFDDPGFPDFDAAVAYLDRWLGQWHTMTAYEFNDTRGRTRYDIRIALWRAAVEWDLTHGGAA